MPRDPCGRTPGTSAWRYLSKSNSAIISRPCHAVELAVDQEPRGWDVVARWSSPSIRSGGRHRHSSGRIPRWISSSRRPASARLVDSFTGDRIAVPGQVSRGRARHRSGGARPGRAAASGGGFARARHPSIRRRAAGTLSHDRSTWPIYI